MRYHDKNTTKDTKRDNQQLYIEVRQTKRRVNEKKQKDKQWFT